MSVLNKVANEVETKAFDFTSQDASAVALASKIGHTLDADLTLLAKAKQDWEGGPFRCLFTILGAMDAETIASLPDTLAETGNNPRFYKSRKLGTDGKEKITNHDYYKVLASNLPGIRAKAERIELLGRSMKDPAKFNLSDIPQAIKDMTAIAKHAEIASLQTQVNTGKNAVVKAFELYWQLERFGYWRSLLGFGGEGLAGITASVIFAVDKDGKLMDGNDGREFQVDATRTPIVIQTKLEARKLVDNRLMAVGAFLALPVAKIKEQGGSYQAFEAVTKKGTKSKDDNAKSNPINIQTVDTGMGILNDVAEWMYRIQDANTPEGKSKAEWQLLDKACNGAGSDDNFYNARLIYESLKLLVGKPKDDVRWQKLFSEREEAAA